MKSGKRNSATEKTLILTWEGGAGEVSDVEERLGSLEGDPVVDHDGVQSAPGAVVLGQHLAQQVLCMGVIGGGGMGGSKWMCG